MSMPARLQMALHLAVPFAARAAVPVSTIAVHQQRADANYWGMERMYAAEADPCTTVVDDSPALHEWLRTAEQRTVLGKRASIERFLVDRHLTEADAAKAHVATLSKEMMARRTEMIRTRDAREAELRGKLMPASAGSAHSITASP